MMGAIIGAWGLLTPDQSGTLRALSLALAPSHNGANQKRTEPAAFNVGGRKCDVRQDL